MKKLILFFSIVIVVLFTVIGQAHATGKKTKKHKTELRVTDKNRDSIIQVLYKQIKRLKKDVNDNAAYAETYADSVSGDAKNAAISSAATSLGDSTKQLRASLLSKNEYIDQQFYVKVDKKGNKTLVPIVSTKADKSTLTMYGLLAVLLFILFAFLFVRSKTYAEAKQPDFVQTND